MPDVGEFEDRYCGTWPSFADYSYDYVHETCLLDGLSEEVSRYFDYASFERDLEQDHTTAPAPACQVFVFRST